MINKNSILKYLNLAQEYANEHTGCCKVAVGSMIRVRGTFILSANEAIPDTCKTKGCHRIEVYGEDSKNHRLPSDCRAIHSEVEGICRLAKIGLSTNDATIIVTRYPCEACARAIAAAGIREVYYGRKQKISKETERIFKATGVKCHHVAEWDYEDTER